jgi:hypothetical protein
MAKEIIRQESGVRIQKERLIAKELIVAKKYKSDWNKGCCLNRFASRLFAMLRVLHFAMLCIASVGMTACGVGGFFFGGGRMFWTGGGIVV